MRGRVSGGASAGLLSLLSLFPTLAGCAPGVTGILSGVICPPAGTRVDRRGSEDVVYAGSDPYDPAVCLTRGNEHAGTRALAALFTQPAPDEASLRQGLAGLFPLAIGRRTSFIWRAPVAGSSAEIGTFQESWRVTGERAMRVGSATRRVWLVEREQQNVSGNESRFAYRLEVQYAIDKLTGAPLSFGGRAVTRGGSATAVPAWTAASISAP